MAYRVTYSPRVLDKPVVQCQELYQEEPLEEVEVTGAYL